MAQAAVREGLIDPGVHAHPFRAFGRELSAVLPPLTIIHEAALPGVGRYEVSPPVSMTFYDFGAVSISYEIAFAGGTATNTLPPREAAYYRVVLPASQPSWKVQLGTLSGDSMLVVTTNWIPNMDSEKRMQKNGNEQQRLAHADEGITSARCETPRAAAARWR